MIKNKKFLYKHENPSFIHEGYYTNSEYYQNPSKEAVVNIIDIFNKYRFENAINAIWKRSIFILFGSTILYLLITILTLFNKILKFFNKSIKQNKKSNITWINFMYNSIQKNKLLYAFTWFIILNSLTILKLLYYITKGLLFIYTYVLKPLFIPIAIIISALILSKYKRNY